MAWAFPGAAQLLQEQEGPQSAAGAKNEFEVASVREDVSGKFFMPYPIDADDEFVALNGNFVAHTTLSGWIAFAYKLPQENSLLSHLPGWASTKQYEIRAKVEGNPSKDQVRLMMRSLLADRFKLKLHFEKQETPVLVLTLLRPGKFGPNLRMHSAGPACNVVEPRGSRESKPSFDMFPCNLYMSIDQPDHSRLAGSRNTTIPLMAAFFTNVGHLGRPVVDQTGIEGVIDFSMEYMPERRGVVADADSDLPGVTFLEAIKDQLGLKLEPKRLLIDIPVIDHVETPSEN